MILGRRERAFITEALFYAALDSQRLRRLSSGGLAWRQLVSRAQAYGLAPALAWALEEAGLWGDLDPDVASVLRTSRERNAAQNAVITALLPGIQHGLWSQNVASLPVKGAAMLVVDPRLVEIRHIDDIDLVVRPADAGRAVEALVGLGWTVRQETRDLDGHRLEEGGALGRVTHGAVLVGPTGLSLELHHALPGRPGQPWEPTEGFFRRSLAHRRGQAMVQCPAMEDLAAIACSHAMLHHRMEGLHVARMVMDLHALRTSGWEPTMVPEDWGEPASIAVAKGLGVLAKAHRGRSSPTLLGWDLHERMLSPLWAWLGSLISTLVRILRAPLVFLRALRHHGWRAIFPSREYMANRYGLDRSSPLVFLAYVWRPIRGGVRLLFRR